MRFLGHFRECGVGVVTVSLRLCRYVSPSLSALPAPLECAFPGTGRVPEATGFASTGARSLCTLGWVQGSSESFGEMTSGQKRWKGLFAGSCLLGLRPLWTAILWGLVPSRGAGWPALCKALGGHRDTARDSGNSFHCWRLSVIRCLSSHPDGKIPKLSVWGSDSRNLSPLFMDSFSFEEHSGGQ